MVWSPVKELAFARRAELRRPKQVDRLSARRLGPSLPFSIHGLETMVRVRVASAADSSTIAEQRAGMFADMGLLPVESHSRLVQMTIDYLTTAIPAGEYVGWLAVIEADPATVIGGAGVQLRRVLPFPNQGSHGTTIAEGRQAIVLNVYTDPTWRRRGVARSLMEAVLAWARAHQIESLVLHASPDGRALYEHLGFAETNEMRFMGGLAPDSA